MTLNLNSVGDVIKAKALDVLAKLAAQGATDLASPEAQAALEAIEHTGEASLLSIAGAPAPLVPLITRGLDAVNAELDQALASLAQKAAGAIGNAAAQADAKAAAPSVIVPPPPPPVVVHNN